ncbi:MAG: PDZ domain-containing protein [Kofleriaceae bacterium]|nr:PDZ domain-containing protein [Kofleriaceae bacterium]
MKARWLVTLSVAVLGLACAYPRRSTALSPVRAAAESSTTPTDVWALTIVAARIPPRSRGGLAWDGTDGLPDAFVRIYRNDQLVFESPAANDSLSPEWELRLPRNFFTPADASYRFELWDRDDIGADPIGMYRNRSLPPNLVADADASLMLEGGAQLMLRLSNPQAHSGVGISLYELRGDALVVVEVETHSPAGRAGLAPGDAIVAIGGETVSDLGPQGAPGALSMAAQRQQRLRVRGSNGQMREVDLDRGYTWLSM